MGLPHSIWFLFFDDHQILDIAGPVAAISAVNDLFPGAPPYEITLVADRKGVVPSNSALRVIADADWRDMTHKHVDTLVVVGGWHMPVAGEDNALCEFIALTGRRAQRICSICTGAFLLGAAGLLVGKRVATHWSAADDLVKRFPSTTIDRNAIYVVDENVWTSAGVTTGIDMTLALIEADHGHSIALSVAKRLVLYMIRPGGQAQFSIHIENVAARSDVIQRVTAFIESNLTANVKIEDLATQCKMSVRNFSRRFHSEIGQSPTEFITTRRLAKAQTLLEKTDLLMKSIACQCGFTSVGALRRAFVLQFAVSPTEYRQRFGAKVR